MTLQAAGLQIDDAPLAEVGPVVYGVAPHSTAASGHLGVTPGERRGFFDRRAVMARGAASCEARRPWWQRGHLCAASGRCAGGPLRGASLRSFRWRAGFPAGFRRCAGRSRRGWPGAAAGLKEGDALVGVAGYAVPKDDVLLAMRLLQTTQRPMTVLLSAAKAATFQQPRAQESCRLSPPRQERTRSRWCIARAGERL